MNERMNEVFGKKIEQNKSKKQFGFRTGDSFMLT